MQVELDLRLLLKKGREGVGIPLFCLLDVGVVFLLPIYEPGQMEIFGLQHLSCLALPSNARFAEVTDRGSKKFLSIETNVGE